MGDDNMQGFENILLGVLVNETSGPYHSTAAASSFLPVGTVKEVSIWITTMIMSTASIQSFKRIPWHEPARRRFHVIPFMATTLLSFYYFSLAWSFLDQSNGNIHQLADPKSTGGSGYDWELGSQKRHAQVETYAGVPDVFEYFQWRYILMLWISQILTCALNSLSTGLTVFALLSVFEIQRDSTSEMWQLVLEIWPRGVAVISLAWSFYKGETCRNVQYRKFFFKLAGYIFYWYHLQGLVLYCKFKRNLPPSDFEYILYPLIDVFLNAGLTVWLFNTDIPHLGEDDNEASVEVPEFELNLSYFVMALLFSQIAMWYYIETNS